MPKWLRRTAGILTLGGSAVGAVLSLLGVLGSRNSLGSVVIFFFAIVLFATGIAIGTWILEGNRRGLAWGVAFWCLQIPLLSSSLISYQFSTGAFVGFSVSGDAMLRWNALVGSNFNFTLLSGQPLAVGMNVFALAMTIVLWRASDGEPLPSQS